MDVDTDVFRDLQLSFLKASVPDLEIPTDHALVSLLNKIAKSKKIRYVISGHNTATECIAVSRWSHGHYDWRYIKLIQKRFGSLRLRGYAHTSLWNVFTEQVLGRIKTVRLLNYLPEYNKEKIVRFLEDEYGWVNYTTKHGESDYTFFVQAYVLPLKFGYDKRRMHLSDLICSRQLTRDEALAELEKPSCDDIKALMLRKMVCKRFGMTEVHLDALLRLPNKSYYDYPSYETHFVYRFIREVYKKMKGV